MATEEMETQENVEAGDYIEDDPEAWAAWVETLHRYVARHYQGLVTHLGSEEAAVQVIAGTMLSYLADRHGLYLRREEPR